MGIGCRKFFVDDEGGLVRLRNTIFDRLLRDPQHHTMPAFAGQRVCMAEILVQLADRKPIRVVRRVYFVAAFDEAGRLDTARFLAQQRALAELALDGVFTEPAVADCVLDAASRFIAQGGRWRPPNALPQRIDDAALGHSQSNPGRHARDVGKAAVRGQRQSAICRRW